ncbi:GFA family protein [Roseobacter ponti]|uniref:GFA family protein n=1 Tax=Roseobacter ponti TaxID=1891787 RepID=A0A858SWK8_9RHOB|nr:GFA family protein [Roseobacter ponti]QJF52417.1 GFA family protein [Roseobacter ponti]
MAKPQTAVRCHCSDGLRVTGAPPAAFAAPAFSDLAIRPDPDTGFRPSDCVERRFCVTCGSPLYATWAHLPEQIYIPPVILNEATGIAQELRCHSDAVLPRVSMDDGVEKVSASGRETLRRPPGPL